MTDFITNENISATVNELTEYYQNNKIDKRLSLENTLALEEILLQYQEQFGKDATYTFEISKKFGIHHAVLQVKGEQFNPLEGKDDENEQYTQKLLTELGIAPKYSYRKKTNFIDIQTEKHKLSSVSILLLCLVSSIILGLINKLFVPASIADVIANEIFRPISDTFSSFINALVGPVVFFTIIVATINVGDLSSLKKFGRTVLRYLFLFSSLIFVLSSIIPIVLVGIDEGGLSESPVYIVRDTILSIIPNNIVLSFSDNSILQLMFWGILVGLSILALDKQSSGISEGFTALKEIFTHIMSFVGYILPIYIFTSVFIMVYEESESVIKGGSIFAYYLICFLSCLLLMIVFTMIFAKVPVKKLMKYSLPSILAAAMSCSSLISLGSAMSSLSDADGFNIDRKKVEFVTPISQALFKPFISLNILAIILGLFKMTDTPLSMSNMITLIVLSFIFGIATPPVACGGAAVMTILFSTFHLSNEYLVLAIAIDTLLDYFTTGISVLGNFVCVLLIDSRTKTTN